MSKVVDIMVDVESDGPVPPLFSMVSLGAIVVEPSLDQTFYAKFKPISENWDPKALSISGHSREECMGFPDAKKSTQEFCQWVLDVSRGARPRFWSDNNGFDWGFANYYFHAFVGSNPFGWSSVNLNSVYKGMEKTMNASFKHLVETPHSHHPVDDATGCAEALLKMKAMGFSL